VLVPSENDHEAADIVLIMLYFVIDSFIMLQRNHACGTCIHPSREAARKSSNRLR
jgi:hypothetical protein